MPRLTRWLIKAAFIYLAGALLLGVALALPAGVGLPRFVRAMGPVYFHLFLVGWVTQMIFGVVYWMFPIITRERPRGSAPLGWASASLLNGGLLLRVVGEPLVATRPAAGFGWLLAVSALLQWLGVAGLVVLAWPRVKDRYRGE